MPVLIAVRSPRPDRTVVSYPYKTDMSKALQAVRGMNDILPDEAEIWEQFEDIVRNWLHSYGQA